MPRGLGIWGIQIHQATAVSSNTHGSHDPSKSGYRTQSDHSGSLLSWRHTTPCGDWSQLNTHLNEFTDFGGEAQPTALTIVN
jgi:hypothetical protein